MRSSEAFGGSASAWPRGPALNWLFPLLAPRAPSVQPRRPQDPHGAAPRPVLERSGLFLPPGEGWTGDAERWTVQRAALAHAAGHWRFSALHQSGRGLKPMGHAVVGALEDARVEALMVRQFPGVRRWFLAAFPPEREALSREDFPGLLARLHWALADPAHEDAHGWIVKARTLFEAHRGTLDQPGPLRAAASVLANDLGQMRVRMNLQGFHVPAPYRDDNSCLWDLGAPEDDPSEAQDIVVQHRPVRPPDEPPAEAQPPVASPQELPYHYPEWDYRLERRRADWCTVFERQAPLGPADGALSRSTRGRAGSAPWQPAPQLDRHVRLRRQWQGDDLDLAAAVDWRAEQRALSRPSPRVFVDAGRRPRPLSVLVLVDLSESCNDPLPGAAAGGPTLLDLQKQALGLLVQRLDARTSRLAVHGFCSNTRQSISYFRMLDFATPFEARSAARFGALQARHSTRLGAALRHATRLAGAEEAARRAIVVVTDGVPSDIDVFDPRYLAEDARAAVREARRAAVEVACLAVGGAAHAGLRNIYGRGGYSAVRDAGTLPVRLLGLLNRLR